MGKKQQPQSPYHTRSKHNSNSITMDKIKEIANKVKGDSSSTGNTSNTGNTGSSSSMDKKIDQFGTNELSKQEKAHGMNPNQQTNQKIVDQGEAMFQKETG